MTTALAVYGSAAVAGDGPGRLTGQQAIPANGRVTIPVIEVLFPGDAPRSTVDMSFFSNKLNAITFRNYWHTNSNGKYDPRTMVARHLSEDSSSAEKLNDAATRKEELIDIAETMLGDLIAQQELAPASLDSTGVSFMPDGWTDGLILIVPGLDGAAPVVPGNRGKKFFQKLSLGPFLAVGPETGKEEILKGFSRLLGLQSIGVDCTVCLSLCASTNDDLLILDAYSRMKAGWVDVLGLDGPPGTALILPSRTTGKIYRIGAGKEYFLIENRSPGKFTDIKIGEPGLAIYHVDENAATHGKRLDTWRPRVVNESPDASFPLQNNEVCRQSECLFREGDSFVPDYENQNAPSEHYHPLNSNYYSGEPSDIIIEDIDTKNHFPIIRAVIGYR